MNNEQLQFMELLKKALHPEVEIDYRISNDLDGICKVAAKQKVLPIIYKEIAESPVYQNDEMIAKAKPLAIGTILRQARKTEFFLQIYNKILQQGIHPTVMKGIICRNCYGKLANLRESCDEDILVKKEEFRAVQSILEKEGYQCDSIKITDELLEEMQEITFTNYQAELSIEVHTNPIGHENDVRSKINDYFCNIEGKIDVPTTMSNGQSVQLRTFNDTDHFMFLVFHAYKHFTFYGFGIRQCMDILVYQEIKSESIDWKTVKKKLSEVKALEFLADIQDIGNRYLGFDLPLITKTNCSDDLLEDLMLNGIYGNETQAQRTAEGLTSSIVSSEQQNCHRIKRWIYTIFPQKERMIQLHPELVNRPWLLPICWAKRWGRLRRHAKDYDGDLFKESVMISNRRVALMRKYKIVK